MNTEVVEGKPERRARAAGSVWHGQPVQIGRKVKLGLGEKVKVKFNSPSFKKKFSSKFKYQIPSLSILLTCGPLIQHM